MEEAPRKVADRILALPEGEQEAAILAVHGEGRQRLVRFYVEDTKARLLNLAKWVLRGTNQSERTRLLMSVPENARAEVKRIAAEMFYQREREKNTPGRQTAAGSSGGSPNSHQVNNEPEGRACAE